MGELTKQETVYLPMIKCNICHNLTTSGLHQIRLMMIKKGYPKKENGRWGYVPPVMKRVDLYMCTRCVEGGRKWPGQRP